MNKKTAIKEINEYSRKNYQLRLDSDIMTLLKILAGLKDDSVNNVVNDIIRAFAEKNKDVLNNFQKVASDTYDKIEW